ncbi:MAG TPA: hypothetical protein GX509_09400 [Firmicutes bacterium]|nr:hypothetical protein [Bacillota bacterium]
MEVTNRYLNSLSEADLDFIIRTVVTKRSDYDEIRGIVKGKGDLIDIMLDDERLFRAVMADDDIFLKLSPFLLFIILLRKVYRDLKETTFTIEPVGKKERLPVFDAPQVVELLGDKDICTYLADMLSSFTKVGTTTLYFKNGPTLSKRVFNDTDLEDVVDLSNILPEDSRFSLYKRAADICLFLTGVFPDYIFSKEEEGNGLPKNKEPGNDQGGLEAYEKQGQMFYRQAALHKVAKAVGLDRVLLTLSEKFILARKPLTIIADRYMGAKRDQWFNQWAQSPTSPGFGA